MPGYLQRMAGAAVFDLDNTLVRGSFLFHFGAGLVRRGVLHPRHLLPFALAECRYARGRQEQAGMPERIARCTLGLARGWEQAHLADLAMAFTQRSLDRFVITGVADLAQRICQAGIPVFIATASPQELAQAVAARLHLTGAIGTQGEVVDGRYTGRLDSPIAHGAMKAHRVASMLESHDLDPRDSWAFTDSVNDLPLLTLVGHPVAVKPDPHLRRIAGQNGWGVLVDDATDVDALQCFTVPVPR